MPAGHLEPGLYHATSWTEERYADIPAHGAEPEPRRPAVWLVVVTVVVVLGVAGTATALVRAQTAAGGDGSVEATSEVPDPPALPDPPEAVGPDEELVYPPGDLPSKEEPAPDVETPELVPPSPAPEGDGTPVAVNGRLHVCGTNLCNERSEPIQLRGMSTHGIQWYSQCVNDASLDVLANDWNTDVVRISMYIQEGGYETDPRRFTDMVHDYVEKVTARGMYVILDWHQLSPGDPNHNLDQARTFFTEIVQRHAGKNNLIYEVANEPNNVSWSRVRSYHEEIIPVIRAHDPAAVILLGTHGWGSFGVSDGGSEADVINDSVDADNIMYTFHFYAASHGESYLNALSRSADQIPIFVTEFGTQTHTGDGDNDFGMSQRYIDLMAQKKISWVNWNFSDDHRSGAVFQSGVCPSGPFTDTSQLKEAGVWIRDRIRA